MVLCFVICSILFSLYLYIYGCINCRKHDYQDRSISCNNIAMYLMDNKTNFWHFQGDSGGPVLLFDAEKKTYTLEGIVSKGSEDCRTLPSVHIDIHHPEYINWIREKSIGNAITIS